jgi:hypothetical protein
MNYRRLILPAMFIAFIAALLLFTGGPADACAQNEACYSGSDNGIEFCENCRNLNQDMGDYAGCVDREEEMFQRCFLEYTWEGSSTQTCIDGLEEGMQRCEGSYETWTDCITDWDQWIAIP